MNLPASPACQLVPQAAILIFLSAWNSASLDVHFFQKNFPGVLGDAAERGVLNGARLLVNLLEHEVLEAALFRHDRVPGDALGLALHLLALEIGDAHALLGDDRDLAVGEKEEVASVIEQCGYVAGDKIFVFAEADYDRRTVAGGYYFARFIGGDDDQRENARQFFHRFANRFFQRSGDGRCRS